MTSREKKIMYKGEKIDLLKCKKVEKKSYYKGAIFLKKQHNTYAEFTCIPEGIVIRLTDEPESGLYRSKETGFQNGIYKIPDVLFEKYKLYKKKTSALFQLNDCTFFLRGSLTMAERENFHAPVFDPNNMTVSDVNAKGIDPEKLTVIRDTCKRQESFEREFDYYKVNLFRGSRSYVEFQGITKEESDCLYSVNRLKTIFGCKAQNFTGNKISFCITRNSSGIFYLPSFIFDLIGYKEEECSLKLDTQTSYYYIIPKDIHLAMGDIAQPAQENPVRMTIKKDHPEIINEMIRNILLEFEIFADNYKKLIERNEELQRSCSMMEEEKKKLEDEIRFLRSENKDLWDELTN